MTANAIKLKTSIILGYLTSPITRVSTRCAITRPHRHALQSNKQIRITFNPTQFSRDRWKRSVGQREREREKNVLHSSFCRRIAQENVNSRVRRQGRVKYSNCPGSTHAVRRNNVEFDYATFAAAFPVIPSGVKDFFRRVTPAAAPSRHVCSARCN